MSITEAMFTEGVSWGANEGTENPPDVDAASVSAGPSRIQECHWPTEPLHLDTEAEHDHPSAYFVREAFL